MLETGEEDVKKALEEARKLLEVRLRELQKTEQFKAILENINHGVIAVDRQGVVTILNKAAARITGISQKNVQGRLLTEVVPRDFVMEEIGPELPRIGKLIRMGKTLALSQQGGCEGRR